MNIKPLYRLLGLLGLVAPLMTGVAAAQLTTYTGPTTTTGRVMVGPVTGALGLESTIDTFYSRVHSLVKVMGLGGGIERTRTRGLEAVDSLQPGAPVVAYYVVKGVQASAINVHRVGPGGLQVNEGISTRVDRSNKPITITFSHGSTETLRSTRQGVQDAC